MLKHSASQTEAFEPDKKIAVTEYPAPTKVWLESGKLCWQPGNLSGLLHVVRPEVKSFLQFIDLRAGTDADILKYAKRWGVLELCEKHRLPTTHMFPCQPLGTAGEYLDEWRAYAKIAAAILEISQRLDDGKLGALQDWKALRETNWFSLELDWMKTGYRWTASRRLHAETEEKMLIAHFINQWLALGNVRPRAEWFNANKGLTVRLGIRGLFGALAVQLLEIAGRYVLAACSECRKFYYPRRRPKASQNRYCPDCDAAGIPLLRASQWRNLRKLRPGRKAK